MPEMSEPLANIILVGFMASGKTVVGGALSRLTGRPLVDADDEIVRRAGQPVHQIFRDQGEAAFRQLERSVIHDLCSQGGSIIAAGGGAFVDLDNRKRMLAAGLVICLSARPETIYRRITGSCPVPYFQGDGPPIIPLSQGADPPVFPPCEGGNTGGSSRPVRPLLAGDDPMERIQELLARRADAYAQAHHTVETDSQGTLRGVPAAKVGRYQLTSDDADPIVIGANLLSSSESQLASIKQIQFKELTVTAATADVKVDRSFWPTLALLALGVLMIEWWFFHKRAGGYR